RPDGAYSEGCPHALPRDDEHAGGPVSELGRAVAATPPNGPMNSAADMGTGLRPDPAALAAVWDQFAIKGATYQVRCPHARRGPLRWYRGTAAGYFTNRAAFVEEVARITGADAPGVYITLNPVQPELRARANNRLTAGMKATTADDQISARRRLLLDFDP